MSRFCSQLTLGMTLLVFALLSVSRSAQAQNVCRDATICQPLVATQGDYELAVDPQDDHVLLLTNVGGSCQNWPPLYKEEIWPTVTTNTVLLRRLDTTGTNILSSFPIGNYAGCPSVNGPEFILPYDRAVRNVLRVVYRDLDGIKLRKRPHIDTPAANGSNWDDFEPEQSLGPPSAYPSSNLVAYSTDIGYGAFAANPSVTTTCEADLSTPTAGSCFGSFNYNPTVTEVQQELESGPMEVYSQTAHPTRAGVVAVTGCTTGGTCGMTFVEMDLASGGVTSTTSAWTLSAPRQWRETLRGAAFPDSTLAPEDRDVLWFTTDEGIGGASGAIRVAIESGGVVTEASFSPITPPASGPLEHVAVAVGADELVMYYQVRQGANPGNYRLIVNKVGASYSLRSGPTRFSHCTHGVEVLYVPSAGWLSYEDSEGPLGGRNIYRCAQPW